MLSKRDYILVEDDVSRFVPDQTIIIKKRHLVDLPGIRFEENSSEPFIDSEDWYPMANSYYSFTEDVDAFARVNHLLESRRGLSSVATLKTDGPFNPYSERAAHYEYLRRRPVSFFIAGKPGLGEEELGKRLSEYWKCVYVTPLTLLEEEIESGSRAGQCIEFNLRCGRAVGVDVLVRLLARKLQTPAVLHRGFVLCGFPLIPNDLFEEDPISSESAVFNVQEIFEEIIEQTVQSADASNKMVVSMIGSAASPEPSELDETVEPEEINSDFKMSYDYVIEDSICGPKEISNDLQKQLNCLFGFFQEQFLLIYMYAANRDVVSKRNNLYFDVYTKNTLDMEKIELFHKTGASNEELTEDLFDGGRNPFAGNPDLKHLIKLPENFPANVNSQLKRYHDEIANILDCRVLLHDVQFYLKLDARAFFSRMMRLIKMRLKILPVQSVSVPQKFTVEREEPGEGDEEPELSLDEHFAKLSKTEIVSPIFKWTRSEWGFHCPVSLSRGIYTSGSPDFAVHFLSRIFFLRDRKALEAFVGNPRPFLLPPFPRPGSRVFVFGPPISGKSAVAKCLGFLLNSRVLTPRQLHTEYLTQMVTEHRDRVKQAALVEGLEVLTETRTKELETKQEERKRSIEEWENEAVIILNELKIYLEEFIQESKNVIGSFPVELEKPASYTDFFNMEQGSALKEQLLSHNLPVIANPTKCEELMEDREKLLKYLPQELKTDISVEPATVFDPFVLEYAEKKVEEMNVADIDSQVESNEYQVFVRGIKATQEETEYDGWIIDDMTTNLSLLTQILEEFSVDEVIILTAANTDFLRTSFQKHDKLRTQFSNFRGFFLSIGEEEAAWRSSSATSTASYRNRVVQQVLSEVLRFEQDKQEIEAAQELALQQYEQQLVRYFEEIEAVRSFFKNKEIEIVEVDLEELPISELLKKVVFAVRDKYRPIASEFSDADRAEEVRQFFVEPAGGGEGENEVKVAVEDFFAANRRYGDTYHYCPVSFFENFVLWRGKEEYAAKFRGKVHLMATEEDLKKFIKSPRSYLLQSRPPDRFPPPRVCVVGPFGAGKTTVSKLLVKNLGVRYYDFQDLMRQAVNKISSLSITLREEEDEVIPDALLLTWYEALVRRLWFEEPNKYTGFVLDDFPRQGRDLEFLVGKKAIPDLVVCMALSREEAVKRVLEETVKVWRERNEEDRLIDETLRSLELKNWEERRKKRYDELMEERKEQRYAEKKKEMKTIDEGNEFTSDTQVSFDSVIEQQEEDEVMKILNEEFPEPFFRETTETEEEMVERVTAEVEKKHAHIMEHVEEMRKTCEKHLIRWVDVDANRSIEQIATHLYYLTEDIKYRGKSFFERCYDVDLETAEKLLVHGYYFLPIFGRYCPVQYKEDHNPLQIYFASQAGNAIYPVIHRSYIYFVHGKKNRDKFVKNPLDYVYPKNYDFLQVPVRVAVIGPPKSGKSTLARRFLRGLGFNTITRGQAIREVLNHPLYSNLREPVEKVLRKGEELSEEMVMDCVHAASHCGECVTFGLVFDGFPNTITELNLLCKLGMVPHLIYDLQVSDEDVFHLAKYPNEEKYPLYSQRYVDHLLKEWRVEEKEFRTWCDREYQNIYKLPTDRSIWGVWEKAKDLIQNVVYERKHYYKHAKSDWPLRLAYMLVTPLEFLERQSNYKTHCPVCIYNSQTFKEGGDPPERSGLIHFRQFFYWICEEHVEEFLKLPEKFIPPSNKSLPQDLPKRVVLRKDPEEVAENGFCLVCYWKNVPKKVIKRGSNQHACSYKNKIYLFESAACAEEFLANPVEYYQLTINFKDDTKYVSLTYRDLPVLGMLEQFVARTVVRAVSNVNLLRPVIPGLSVSAAALICVGLNLKIHNGKISKEYREKYEEALQIFHRRRLDLIKYLDVMKRYLNPEVHYEEPEIPEEEVEEEEEEEDEDYDHELAAKLNKGAAL